MSLEVLTGMSMERCAHHIAGMRIPVRGAGARSGPLYRKIHVARSIGKNTQSVREIKFMIKNFAHRGFSGRYPENTMLAFRKAYEAGCDGIEIDVQLSKDGIPVIIHDEELDRTTTGSGPVADHTLSELKALDASYIFGDEYGRCEIPTLREYFEFAKESGVYTNLELKTSINDYPGIEEKVAALIEEFGLSKRILISSFNHHSVLRMRALMPDMKYAFLTDDWILDAAEYASRYGVCALHPRYNLVDEEYIRLAREKDLKVNVWTVNTEQSIKRMADLKVDCVIGNFPDLALQVLREHDSIQES